MLIELNVLHWVYVIFTLLILGFMVAKRDTTLVCIIGIFLLSIIATSSLSTSIMTIFNSFIFAIVELLGTILIISIIVGMSSILTKTGISQVMISPFTKFIKTPTLAYWVIGILMMIISWFFWPSPAVALLGAVLLPVAIEAGLPALGVAVAMNLFGHGIALSSDFIIQGAPKITADAAEIPVTDLISSSIPLVFVMGIVTTIAAFVLLKKDLKNGRLKADKDNDMNTDKAENDDEDSERILSIKVRKIFSVIVPIVFLIDVIVMSVASLQGGDATALIGGTAVLILIIVSMSTYRDKALEQITSHLVEGLKFGFQVFGPIIPIAAFFYLGGGGFTSVIGEYLPAGSQGIVNDLGLALANVVPLNAGVGAVTLTTVGGITGLDGSGFSGLALAGSVANLFSIAIGRGIETLAALGQIAAIWIGGGTLIPWAVIPVAAICKVDPFDLTRKNFKPVMIGLAVTTIVGIFLI